MSEPRLLGRRTAYKGRILDVGVDRLQLADGGTIDFEVVRHRGGAAVAAITADEGILLIRQYRHATGEWLLEAPAGKLEPGEEPAVCAGRELEEETGWRAGELVSLGGVRTSPGFTDEVLHLFLARQLSAGTQALERTELLTVEELPLTEAVVMALDGRITDAKTVCAVLRAAAVVGR